MSCNNTGDGKLSDGGSLSIYGSVYVNVGEEGDGVGIASYHFVSKDEAYVSYEHDSCAKLFSRLSDGARLPRRTPFQDTSYDSESRTFRGHVTFSEDLGTHERIRTCDGIEKECYELVFSEDFEAIVSGYCRGFYPNASKAHQNVRYNGKGVRYRRWTPETPQQELEKSADDKSNEQKTGTVHNAVAAILARDEQKLRDALNSGVPVDTQVAAAQLWRCMRWDPGLEAGTEQWQAALLAASIMLQWPEGVQICVRHGGDVNCTYAGPWRSANGDTVAADAVGVPMLRLALAAQSVAQCLICRYILDGKVNPRTFKLAKKKWKSEMEVDTRDLFDRWLGPFAHTGSSS